ncbi:hypothetical protein BJX70DRAFT_387312 [Aspergillus crustosus]
MSSQRYQRVNAHDDDGDDEAPPSIALQPTPSSPPPSFRSRSESPSSRRLLRDDPLHQTSTDQTLADAFDDSGSEAGDEPDDRQRLMRAQPDSWSPSSTSSPPELLGASSSSGANSVSPPESNTQPARGIQRRTTLLPFFGGGSGSNRDTPSSNDGVFANLAAKPERGGKTEDLPPSYEEAAADATPPYWETTIVAPGMSSDEVYVDGLPVGSIFSFVWNAMISMSFQLVGFLLTYLLHTTHAAKNGSRAGLGLTLVQYGFYMKGGSDSRGSDGGSDEHMTPPDPNSHSFDPSKVTDSASSRGDGGGGSSTITTSEWISYVLMIVGWFILIRAISDFLRARRHEQLVLQSPERGLPVPVIAENERSETVSPSFPAPLLQQGPVEARSLSSITSIASNPPNYPRNPAQKKLDPLVLYIVRVPGSKDVFLTPLKPPTKSSVSAEAINASLYYVHVATPDDDILLQEYEEEREELARLRREGLIDDPDPPLPTAEVARLNNVKRKPVGGTQGPSDLEATPLPRRPVASDPSDEQHENRPPSYVAERIPPVLPPRPTMSETSNSSEIARLAGTEEYRPPMPPRPLPGVPRPEAHSDNFGPSRRNQRWSALPGERHEAGSPVRHSLDMTRPPMRPSSSHDLPPPYSPPVYSTGSPGHSPTRRPRESAPPRRQPGFNITLIRRDPTHGSQWNVATMSTSQLDSRYKSLGLNLPAEARNLLAQRLSAAAHPDSSTPPETSAPRDSSHSRRFHRKLVVSGPQNPEESRNSIDLSAGRPSMDTIPNSPKNTHHSTSSKLKSGYYTFTSPWNGTCTFSTSVNGRSLKCKHMIPIPGYPSPTHSAQENPAVTVAEIRFNTPFQSSHFHHHHSSSYASPFTLSQTTILKDPSSNPDPSAPIYYDSSAHPSKRAAIANLINHSLNRRLSNSSSSSAGGNEPPPPVLPRRPRSEDRLDLSLAREKAGGGMRGDSAKLGKLIIEDEGIKMLDLVVASCMAVWWRGYYY